MSADEGVEPRAWTYTWWLLAGALLGLGIASLLTIGPLLLILAGALAVVGARSPTLRGRAAAAVPAGVGVAALYLAWLNRHGPGTVCEATGTELSCTDQWSPWPFVIAAALLVATAFVLARGRRS